MNTYNYVFLYFYTHIDYIKNVITSPEREMHVTALFVSMFGLLQGSNGNMTLRVSPHATHLQHMQVLKQEKH